VLWALAGRNPVGTSPTPPTPGGSTDITAMDYLQDNVGTKIPRFSHVRKAHPRDLGLDSMGCPLPNRDTAKNHRLIRRGITYGTRLPAGSADDSCDRGLLFVGYQASLHEQFEFLAHHWLNLRSFPPLDPNVFPENPPGRAGSDPIVGASPNDPPSQRLVVYPTSVTTSGSIVSFTAQELLLDRYIKVRGGGYFFCPGISSLTALAGEPLSPARY